MGRHRSTVRRQPGVEEAAALEGLLTGRSAVGTKTGAGVARVC